MNEKQYHHGDLKASLVAAANIILVRDGADGLSLRKIAAEVGVSHMAPYAHFKNKNELVKSLIESGFEQMTSAMLNCQKALSPLTPDLASDLLLAYGVSYLEFALANPQLYRLMLGQAKLFQPSSKSEIQDDPNLATQTNLEKEHIKRINRPFLLLRDAFAMQVDDVLIAKTQALGAWAIVHGLAALLTEGRIQVPQGMSIKQFLATASSMSFNSTSS
ncbi:TetR/AcrR family transcriptional regulator [Colwellia sp. KU-HH00111]|uniref:TetR/AcrR family transcriptional regulator n=1 Tax=Colwellia sp. KU-HH00111 TaxID=3127652 RepID=UPI003101C0C0